MRKRELEVTNEQVIRNILDQSRVIHLGLCDDGQPYVVPMNYGYVYESGQLVIYVHGAVEGYKYKVIRKNPKVSFSMECGLKPFEGRIACQYGMAYSSILGIGTAEIVSDVEEKKKALTILMKTQTGKEFEFDEKLVSIVNVVKITVSEFSAKQRPLPGTSESEKERSQDLQS